MRTQTRAMKTTYSNFWRVRLTNSDGESLIHPSWIVKIDRTAKRGPNPSHQTVEEIKAETEEAIEKIKALDVDNGPDGEFSHYPDFTVDILEWNNNTSEIP